MNRTAPDIPIQHLIALTIPRAARLSGLPEKAVRHAADTGDLATFTLPPSGVRYVTRRELDDWINSLAGA